MTWLVRTQQRQCFVVAINLNFDKQNIKWIRNKQQFDYIFENKKRKYTPDFYLSDTDEYIEIKGYETDKDRAKWSQFPKDKILKIYKQKELKQLQII